MNNSGIELSVIIPTYNRAHFLKEAVDSVLNQDYFLDLPPERWELWIIDDGSTDTTREMVRSWGSRVSYHFQPNRGASAARNRGLQMATGEYVAFLDSDDMWKPEKIRLQMEFMRNNPDAEVCCT